MVALAIIHKAEICQRLAAGERLSDIAKTYNVSFQAISAPLVDDPDYIAAMDASLDVRMDAREDELESATDQLELARARELLSHARFRAERLAPQRWGKQPDAVPVSVTLNLSSSTLARASTLLPTSPAVPPAPAPLTIDQDEGEG